MTARFKLAGQEAVKKPEMLLIVSCFSCSIREPYNKAINFAPIGAGRPTLHSGRRLWSR